MSLQRSLKLWCHLCSTCTLQRRTIMLANNYVLIIPLNIFLCNATNFTKDCIKGVVTSLMLYLKYKTCQSVVWSRLVSSEVGEAVLLRTRLRQNWRWQGEARQLRIRSRQGRGRLLEAEAEYSRPKQGQSENLVNDDPHNFDNWLNWWRYTHILHRKTLLYT